MAGVVHVDPAGKTFMTQGNDDKFLVGFLDDDGGTDERGDHEKLVKYLISTVGENNATGTRWRVVATGSIQHLVDKQLPKISNVATARNARQPLLTLPLLTVQHVKKSLNELVQSRVSVAADGCPVKEGDVVRVDRVHAIECPSFSRLCFVFEKGTWKDTYICMFAMDFMLAPALQPGVFHRYECTKSPLRCRAADSSDDAEVDGVMGDMVENYRYVANELSLNFLSDPVTLDDFKRDWILSLDVDK